MKGWLSARAIVFACVVLTSACTQALLGDDDYVLDEGVGAGGSSESGAGGEAEGSTTTSSASGAVMCGTGFTACGDECVMLDSNAHHCGACDRDCFGSSCNAGLCAVVVVASDVGDPRDIALDATHVYWTTGAGTVQRAPKEGGAVETIAEGGGALGAIVVDGARAYWVDETAGDILQTPKDGSGKVKKLSNGNGLRRLALDEDSVFFTRKIKKGDVRRQPKEGGGPLTMAKDQPLPTDLVVRGDRLLWSGFADADDDVNGNSIPDGEEGLAGGYVRAMPRLGGDSILLAHAEGEIAELTALGDTAVWADRTYQRIRAYGPWSDTVMTVVADQDVRGLTADSAAIYWTTAGGTVKARALPGGAVQLLAIDLSNAGPVQTDETHVYILRMGTNGAVLRVAK